MQVQGLLLYHFLQNRILMEILYFDQWLMAINKPAGVLSIQDGYDRTAPHVRTILEPEFGRCWIVHRLDKETSGTFLLARTKEMHRLLSILFENRQINKEYRAIVLGSPPQDAFEINYPLRINADRHHRTRVDFTRGKAAQTNFKLMQHINHFSLLLATPLSGYTHQIRSHLAFINLPIIGDLLYSKISKTDKLEILENYPHLALHSYSINFIHPATQQHLNIVSDIPQYMKDLIK
jgi:tRNA pseudouridine32 synthase / 23S rRNA pseudouridine746 synthase